MAAIFAGFSVIKDHVAALIDRERVHELLLSFRERVLEPSLEHVQRITHISEVVGWMVEFTIDAAKKAERILLQRRPARLAARHRRNRAPGGW